jgi:hydrogenase expression/formation protein HypD
LCRAGEVLRGVIKPHQCEAFGKQCTPHTPLGATMVSSEGACAAYYNYGTAGQLASVLLRCCSVESNPASASAA